MEEIKHGWKSRAVLILWLLAAVAVVVVLWFLMDRSLNKPVPKHDGGVGAASRGPRPG